MRIAYVITQGECGGAQKNVRDLAISAKLQGHCVFVITGIQKKEKDAWLFRELDNAGFEKANLIQIELLQREISPLLDIKAFFTLLSLFKRLQLHVVHAHSTKAGIIASIAGKIARAKTVYTIHGFVFSEPLSFLRKLFYIIAEYISSFFRDKTIIVSEFDKKIGERYRIIRKDSSVVIYNGVDGEKKEIIFDAKFAREHIGNLIGKNTNKCNLVGAVANLYETKGIDYFIDAAELIKKKSDQKFLFVVFGEGELRAALEERIQKRHLEDIFFLPGILPDAYKYLKGFDLIVLSSIKEGLPYILLEALLAQVPCVATNVGGVPEIARNTYIRLVDPEREDVLANEILKFFNNTNNYRINKLPEVFTKGYMVKKTLEVYKNITHRSFFEKKEKTFLITLPAFNEQKIIEQTINHVVYYLQDVYNDLILAGRIGLCVAINGSNDKTEEIVEKCEKATSFLTHIIVPEKGRGGALDFAWSHATEDVFIYIDSDLAYDLSDLGKIIDSYNKNEGYDLVVASRRIHGSVVKRNRIRTILTEGYNGLVKILFFNRFSDAQAGCKSIKKEAYYAVRNAVQSYHGWFFDTALLLYSEKNGYKIKDMPIICIDSRKWRLKIIGTVFYFLRKLFYLRIKTLIKGY